MSAKKRTLTPAPRRENSCWRSLALSPSVIDKLDLGYTRLELQKNFKAWGLLRTSDRARHIYSYAINTGGATQWFFSFKLEEGDAVA